jgi:hypothetical protein
MSVHEVSSIVCECSKASAKYNGMENVSGYDWAVNGARRNTRRELHAVKELRRLRHVELPRGVELQQLLSGYLRLRQREAHLSPSGQLAKS